MAIPTNEELDELCRKELDLSLRDLLKIAPVLGQVHSLLEKELYITRFAGLMRTTKKEDPLDCSYVRLCVIDMLKHTEDFQRLMQGLRLIMETVDE